MCEFKKEAFINIELSIDPMHYPGLADDDVTTTILAPLVDRTRNGHQSVVDELEMADVINQV